MQANTYGVCTHMNMKGTSHLKISIMQKGDEKNHFKPVILL